MEAKYLTVNQVAERLNVSARSVRRWIAEGKVRAQRVGGHAVRIEERDVEALVASWSE